MKTKRLRIDGPITRGSWDRFPMAIGTKDNPLEDEYSKDERERRKKEAEKLSAQLRKGIV